MKIPEFATKKELFDWLIKNKNQIITAKKAQMKTADAFTFGQFPIGKDGLTEKANKPITDDVDEIKVRAIINTTFLCDSYKDVHIDGLWNKNLKESKDQFHDQEHKHEFSSTIADYEDLNVYTRTYTWKELKQKWDGETQALVFESNVKKDRNSFMFDQYKQGRVRQHSVGMIYVSMDMAINDKDYKEEFKTWNKYYDKIANKEAVEDGYFFAVTEAKCIEGSAVKRGANWVTPTEDNNVKVEPSNDTQDEPVKTTQKTIQNSKIDLSYLIKHI